MRKIIVIVGLVILTHILEAQNLQTIQVSEVKVVNLYFKENVEKVIPGFPDDFDVSYQGQIVEITSLGTFDYETNLTVTTANGMYGFNVIYKEKPDSLYHTVKADSKVIVFDAPLGTPKTEVKAIKHQTNMVVNQILEIDHEDYLDYSEQQLVYFVLNQAYVKDDKLYFHFSIDNRSAIDYDIDYISVKNKSTKNNTKRTAKEQYDLEYTPHALNEKVKVAEKKSFVLEIDKLTLENKTKIEFGIHELNGGRDGIFSYTQKDFKKIQKLN